LTVSGMLMSVDLREIVSFSAVAIHASLTRAATGRHPVITALHVSQPWLSTEVGKLERRH
jgi:hypothetical protein